MRVYCCTLGLLGFVFRRRIILKYQSLCFVSSQCRIVQGEQSSLVLACRQTPVTLVGGFMFLIAMIFSLSGRRVSKETMNPTYLSDNLNK